jgi:hypothetical protein
MKLFLNFDLLDFVIMIKNFEKFLSDLDQICTEWQIPLI